MKIAIPAARRGAFARILAVSLAALTASCAIQVPNDDAGKADALAAVTEEAIASTGASASTASDELASLAAAKSFAQTAIPNPIMFVTQVPTPGDRFATRLSTFANHLADIASVPRGGDLMIRYPNGTLRNLTREAGFGMDGLQGANAIAVREPTVHWSGNKAIFSMLIGAPERGGSTNSRWQMYEVTGLAQGQTAQITKVANQPTAYNNVSPLYTSDDRILFTSDRPRRGEAHLHPHLDEYESTPTITGIFHLDPASGSLTILNHTPSGSFTPAIDSYGRIIFTRWDHLQRDQQQDAGTTGSFNYASEAANAARIGFRAETFPEARSGMNSAFGPVGGYLNNQFTPWQMNQDGTEELSLNHIGRQELSPGYLGQSFTSDASLSGSTTNTSFIANRKVIRHDGGIFHIRENPAERGIYYAIHTAEFGTLTTGQIIRMTGAPSLNAEQMVITDATPPGTNLPGGRFRNPLPTTSGHMVASYTPSPAAVAGISLRLRQLTTQGDNLQVGAQLTPGITKSVSWWDPGTLQTFNGPLWEIEPVEVVARQAPAMTTEQALQQPEQAVLAAEGVNETTLRNWLRQNDLALIVTRNQTSRDRGDKQQPFNLRVPGGVRTTGDNGRVYDISHYQIMQAELVRAYDNFARGRRAVALPISVSSNPSASVSPPGSVVIAPDGSSAAFVPANRALSWQTVDPTGEPVVRERIWVTMQPGEIRTCAGCHGENSRNQAGQASPVNQPQALRNLLQHWKQNHAGRRTNGSTPLVPPPT